MAGPVLTTRIRAIFLHPESRVTIRDAARMLGWTQVELNAAIRNGDVEAVATRSGRMIELCELELQALQLWSLNTIEDALGPDAGLVMPSAVRTRRLTIHVPQYQVRALTVLASDGHEAIDTMVVRMFDELIELNEAHLSPLIPHLAEAILWPERVSSEGVLPSQRR